jgi:hypothetical protein
MCARVSDACPGSGLFCSLCAVVDPVALPCIALVDLASTCVPARCPSLSALDFVTFCRGSPVAVWSKNKVRLDAFMFLEIMHLRLLNFFPYSYMIHVRALKLIIWIYFIFLLFKWLIHSKSRFGSIYSWTSS